MYKSETTAGTMPARTAPQPDRDVVSAVGAEHQNARICFEPDGCQGTCCPACAVQQLSIAVFGIVDHQRGLGLGRTADVPIQQALRRIEHFRYFGVGPVLPVG